MTGRPAVLQAVFPNNVALGPLPSGTCVGRQGEIDDTAVETAGVMIAQRMVNSAAGAEPVPDPYAHPRPPLAAALSVRRVCSREQILDTPTEVGGELPGILDSDHPSSRSCTRSDHNARCGRSLLLAVLARSVRSMR